MKIKFRLLVWITCTLASLITFESSFANDKIDIVTVDLKCGKRKIGLQICEDLWDIDSDISVTEELN